MSREATLDVTLEDSTSNCDSVLNRTYNILILAERDGELVIPEQVSDER